MILITYYIGYDIGLGCWKILEDIGNVNVIWFCNYNRSRSIGIWIRIGNIIEFCFSF